MNDLNEHVKSMALANGGDLVGIVKTSDMPEHAESIVRILPAARTLVVIASRHSWAAIQSTNNQVAQFDTMHAYNECARSAHTVSRILESKGFAAVAVPAFIPIDMQEPRRGMRGEICWRRAGVRAGLGSYGENGLLVTKEFGSAIRISGLLTSADLEPDSPIEEEFCSHCMRCLESCPSGALSGGGVINKKLCGEAIFKYGFRFFQRFMNGFVGKQEQQIDSIIEGFELRELWQTFMTGNYYYCFECQSQCPATLFPQEM